jgi:hypothetical protein
MRDISAERLDTGYPVDRGYAYTTRKVSPAWTQVSWGAILCGVVIALMVQFIMNMLGLAIGAATIDPVSQTDPVSPALGPAAVIWMAASVLLALFAGGWIAGRLSPTGNHVNTILHGLVVWGVTALLGLAIITSSVGGLITGLGRAVGQGTNLLTTGVVNTLPSVLAGTDFEEGTLGAISGELQTLLDPDGATTTTDATSETEEGTAATTQTSRVTLEDFSLSRDTTEFVTAGEVDEAQRQELVTAMAARTSLSEQEAAERLDNWRTTYQEVRLEVEETAREVADTVTNALAAVAGLIFAVLFIGGAAAGLGAYVAISPREDVPVEASTAEVEVKPSAEFVRS